MRLKYRKNSRKNIVASCAVRSFCILFTHLCNRMWRAATFAGSVAVLLATCASTQPRPDLQLSSSATVVSSTNHLGQVGALAFSPSGDQLATAATDHTVKVWDMRSGMLIRTLIGHRGSVHAVAYAPDGYHLVSGGDDNTIKLWNAFTGQLLFSVPAHGARITSLAYSSDSSLIVSASADSKVKLWVSTTLEFRRTLEGNTAEVSEVLFSNDAKAIVSSGYDGKVRRWETSTGRLVYTMEGHQGRVMTVTLSPDDRYIATGSKDSSIKIWDYGTGQLLQTLPGEAVPSSVDEITSIKFSDDGRYLLAASYKNVARLWSTEGMKLLQTIDDIGFVKTPYVFFLTQRPLVAFVPGSSDFIKWGVGFNRWHLDISQTNISFLNSISVLHTATTQLGHAAIAPDGTEIAAGLNALTFIDSSSGRVVRSLKQSQAGEILAWSSNMRMLAQASGKILAVTDAASGEPLHALSGHHGNLRVAAFSPDNAIIASGDWGGPSNDIILWDVATGKQRLRLAGAHSSVTSLAFSPDSTTLLSGGWDNTVKLWDVTSGALLHCFDVRPGWIDRDTDQLGWVDAAIFVADGNEIATAARDGSIIIWDRHTGVVVGGWEGHAGGTFALAASPAGDILASGGNDGLVKLWDFRRGTL